MTGPLRAGTLIAWLLTAVIGGYMLRTWIARGGLRHQRATGEGVPPRVVFSHAGAALSGIAAWSGYLATRWHPLSWLSVGIAATAITLGICTVTLWTPYPVRSPAGAEPAGLREPVQPSAAPSGTVTDEMIAALLDDPFPARRHKLHFAPLVPALHGVGALATFLLATLATATH